MHLPSLRAILQFLYNFSYYILCVILGALVLVTPGDAVYQAFKNKQLYNVFVVCGCYLLTAVLAGTIYLVRLYTNRQIMAAIPKTWIPIEKGDVNNKVRKMIAASLGRSAVIAWDSQPRVDPTPPAVVSDADAKESIARPETAVVKKKGLDVFRKQRMILSEEDDHIVVIPPNEPLWGDIAHKGWASPESPDLPNLQYVTVILELPHLIEARAVSVAPLDPDSEPDMLLPNMQAVDLLQRPAQMGFRDYVGHLISIGIIVAPTTASEFLVAYEHARFSTEALSEHEFRHLMKLFADLLRSIQPLSPAILVSLALHQPENESDIDDDNTSSTTPRTRSLLSTKSVISHSSSEGTVRTRGDASQSTPMTKFSDFIVTPGTQGNGIRVMSKSTSTDGFAQNRSPYNGSSVRSSASIESSGQASVVRLRAANEAGDLPYTLSIPGA